MITIFTLTNHLLVSFKKLIKFVDFITPVVERWLIHLNRLVAASVLFVLLNIKHFADLQYYDNYRYKKISTKSRQQKLYS